MDIESFKIGIGNKEFDSDQFRKNNIISKLKDCEPIHLTTLLAFYEEAKANGCLDPDGNLNGRISQCESLKEILSKIQKKITNLGMQEFWVCINDLETKGFLLNVQSNPYLEYKYAITPLGIYCIKLIL
ncbi:hypothetical protein DFR58_103259 [Anaerobacterium chartisolvens]|uniref:Uncharacterized protein n=1 Tax=Anaerobacterium chartisolvens TaxID=1297424 RepID=A0A369BD70_9FIRM|nr:hypothetical protein [Anaerobacterium chartisolvens]RCX19512.1 hypothetical protein DFR58_103259 [Anaerobacterium chartisolvens]